MKIRIKKSDSKNTSASSRNVLLKDNTTIQRDAIRDYKPQFIEPVVNASSPNSILDWSISHPIKKVGDKLYTKNGYGDDVEISPEEARKMREEGLHFLQSVNFNSNIRKNSNNENIKAFGGDVQTHISDYSTGMTHIDKGGSHEENPYQGVQVGVDPEGTPNLVEEGETIYNNYVYSTRIYADADTLKKFHISPKAKITFAALTKRLEKGISARPNDPYEKAAFKKQMEELANEQERQKQEMQMKEAQQQFASMSPEEQVALMQQVQQTQQQPQEMYPEEQVAMGNPEEMMPPAEYSSMEQQGIPMDGSSAEGYAAYGGPIKKANRYDYGGALAWLKKNHPEYKGKELEALATYISKLDMNRGYYRAVYDAYRPTQNFTTANIKKFYSKAVSSGLSPETAFKYVFPDSEFSKWIDTGKHGSRENLYRYLSSENNQVSSENNQTSSKNNQTSSKSVKYKGLSGKEFSTRKAVQMDNYNKKNKLGEYAEPSDNKKDAKANASSNKKETKTPVSEGKNSGNWSKAAENENHWGVYTKPGLQAFIDRAREQLSNPAITEEEKNNIRQQIINEFNTIQTGYESIYDSNIAGPHQYSDDVKRHQEVFDKAGGNKGFSSTDDQGNVTNLIASSIDIPKGAKTEDIAGSWKDGYWGPRTSIRNFGSTEYGDDEYYADLVSQFDKLGLDYFPAENYTYKNGDNTYNLYGLALKDSEVPNDASEADDVLDYYANLWKGNGTGNTQGNASPVKAGNKTEPADDVQKKLAPILKDERLRYAGLLGPVVGLGMQMAGIGKPDYTRLDAAVNMIGSPALASYKPIGNYMTYTPYDVWSQRNHNTGISTSTDRAIRNTSSPIGTQNAGLIANGYNSQLANGQLGIQAQQANNAYRGQVNENNKSVDSFNASAFNQTSSNNATILNNNRAARAQMAMNAAQQILGYNNQWYQGVYGNAANAFRGVSDLGKENAQHNMIARMAADGFFGTLGNQYITQDYLKYLEEKNKKEQG